MERKLNRRRFLCASIAASAVFAARPIASADRPAKLRAAIVGHTGKGDYGHGLDVAFSGRGDTEVVAVADPDDSGRAKAKARAGAARDYPDYREMLEKEKPQLVSVAMRWSDQHHAICKAALEAGAHLYVEKPFTTTLAEADELLAIARRKKLKIAVAHQMHLAPVIRILQQRLRDGLIGDLLQVRAHGKQDRRAGGEDMIVLGTHLFDLMRLVAGDARWATAVVLHRGREATQQDATKATEGIGPVLGDEIEAQFGFEHGILGAFTSRGRSRESAGHWGVELLGSKGAVRVLADISPRVFIRQQSVWSDSGSNIEWKPFEPGKRDDTATANKRMVDDLVAAIRDDGEPACNGEAGAKAVEMAMAVYQAGLQRARVSLPLERREHPLMSA